jgi:hypothetical protein
LGNIIGEAAAETEPDVAIVINKSLFDEIEKQGK